MPTAVQVCWREFACCIDVEERMFDDICEGHVFDTGHFLIRVQRPLPEVAKLGVSFEKDMSGVAMPCEMRRIAEMLKTIADKLEVLNAQHTRH